MAGFAVFEKWLTQVGNEVAWLKDGGCISQRIYNQEIKVLLSSKEYTLTLPPKFSFLQKFLRKKIKAGFMD